MPEIRPEVLKALDILGLSGSTSFLSVAWWSGTVFLECCMRDVVFKKGEEGVLEYTS